jgi:rfaE bifunctional protein nucleotidyltransferase chain/domain
VGQVVSQENLAAVAAERKRAGKRVVVAGGAFDLLHPGHIRLLEQARSLGDVVVVAVESDARVRGAAAERAKAHPSRPVPSWPITPSAERAETLAALAAVDYVVELDALSLEDWIRRFRPDVFVQGGFENALGDPAGLEGTGCKILHIPLEPGFSTATLIERIQHLPQ